MTSGLEELRWRTPARWAMEVLADPLALLEDHAHLERAAAANALALVRSFPDGVDSERWVARLSGVARDEVEHLAVVNRELGRRGGVFRRDHTNPYARALRRLVTNGTSQELADRLYVSALIELRSFERFRLLAGTDHELAPLYGDLEASEAGHYRLFLTLAAQAGGDEAEWDRWLRREGEIAARQPPGCRIHAGVLTLPSDDEEPT